MSPEELKNRNNGETLNADMPRINLRKGLTANSGFSVAFLAASFFIPVAVMTIIFFLKKVPPFGPYSIVDEELYSRYLPLLVELRRKLLTGDSLFYSWNIGYGVNFLAFVGTYLSSPLNLILVFFPVKGISDAMTLQMLLRVGLSGLGFAWFLSEKDRIRKAYVPALSTAYALGGYMLAYCVDFSLADAAVLLPFVLLGAWRMIRGHKPLLYTVSLFLLILSAWRTGLYVGLFLILFIPLLYFEAGGKAIQRASRVPLPVRFAVCSLIAAGVAAVFLIPSLLALRGAVTEAGGFRFPGDLKMYFTFFDLGDRLLFRTAPELSLRMPNIYCGVAVMVLVPLFAFQSRITFRERVYALTLLGFLYITMSGSLIDYALNGLVITESGHFRQALVFVFLLLYMTARALRHAADIPKKTLFLVMLGVFAFLVLDNQTGELQRAWQSIYGTALLVFIFGFCIRALDGSVKRDRLVGLIFLIITVAELGLSANFAMDARVKYDGEAAYTSSGRYAGAVREELSSECNRPTFRIASDLTLTDYDGAWAGIGLPDSPAWLMPENLLDFARRNGFGSLSQSRLHAAGYNEVTGMLLGIEGELRFVAVKPNQISEEPIGDFIDESFGGESPPPLGVGSYEGYVNRLKDNPADAIIQYDVSFVRNEHALSLAYRVNPEITGFWGTPSGSPFNNTNAMLERMGAEALYTERDLTFKDMRNVSVTDNGRYAFSIPEESASLIAEFQNMIPGERLFIYVDADIDVRVNIRILLTSNWHGNRMVIVKGRQIVDCGTISDADEYIRVSLSFPKTDSESFFVYAATVNPDSFESVFRMLEKESLRTERVDGSGVRGIVEAEADGALFFSIPYDQGWNIRVDGQSVPIERAAGAWLSVPIRQGTHQIEARYTPPGFIAGALISILSAALFIVLIRLNPAHIMGFSQEEDSTQPSTVPDSEWQTKPDRDDQTEPDKRGRADPNSEPGTGPEGKA